MLPLTLDLKLLLPLVVRMRRVACGVARPAAIFTLVGGHKDVLRRRRRADARTLRLGRPADWLKV